MVRKNWKDFGSCYCPLLDWVMDFWLVILICVHYKKGVKLPSKFQPLFDCISKFLSQTQKSKSTPVSPYVKKRSKSRSPTNQQSKNRSKSTKMCFLGKKGQILTYPIQQTKTCLETWHLFYSVDLHKFDFSSS